jgi:hypothetical protein
MLHASIGSISNKQITDNDNTVRAFMGLRRNELVATAAAIHPARKTDGSPRVNTTNHPMMHNVMTQRMRGDRLFNTGDASASRYATFWPEAAHK